jgi:hypothetical protein
MKKSMVRISLIALAAALTFPAAFGQQEAKPEYYSGVWAVTGGSAGGSTVRINITVSRYNTDAEVQKYAELLKEKGPEDLRRKLEGEDVGRLAFVGRVGTEIAVARKLVNGGKTTIRLITPRNFSYAELHNAGRSVDYPYTIIELTLDKNGKGTGTAMGGASIRFNKKKNIYEIESFQHGTAYNKILNVQTEK